MITHYELCKLTAEKFLRESKIVLYEYQSFATGEFPDVLRFKNGYSWLYEIKVSKEDFKKDGCKQCRIEKKIKYFPQLNRNNIKQVTGISWEKWKPEIKDLYVEYPHLGRERFYVCPTGLIQPEEIKNGFGLYWFDGSKFRKKKDSKKFKANIYEEMRILEHSFRKYACGDGDNILINRYK